MPSPEKFDVVVIGSGPGGYVAAIGCAKRGKSVAIIERDRLGGVCLNRGCIPSKSLIRQASLFRSREAFESLGVSLDISGFDYSRVFSASRKAADTLSRGVAYLMEKNGIVVIGGSGALGSDRTVVIDGSREIRGENIIIATGSLPRELPGFSFDEARVLSSEGRAHAGKVAEKNGDPRCRSYRHRNEFHHERVRRRGTSGRNDEPDSAAGGCRGFRDHPKIFCAARDRRLSFLPYCGFAEGYCRGFGDL